MGALVTEVGIGGPDFDFRKACAVGNEEHVMNALEEEGEVDQATLNNALDESASSGHFDIMARLIEAGADSFQSAAACAIQAGNEEILRFLLEHHRVDPLSGWQTAVNADQVACLSLLSEYASEGGNVRSTFLLNMDLWTASEAGYADTVRFLLENTCADPRTNCYQALRKATWGNHQDVVAILRADSRVGEVPLPEPIFKEVRYGEMTVTSVSYVCGDCERCSVDLKKKNTPLSSRLDVW